jgi:serine/threonine protein kinase
MSKFFHSRKLLGEGAFSTVIRAYDTLSSKEVAIKILDKNQIEKK